MARQQSNPNRWNNKHGGQYQMEVPISSQNGIFTQQVNSKPISGRSPMIGTKIEKLIMNGKINSHQIRQNFLKQQSQPYEPSHLFEDFELMKNVQNLIEQNQNRCSGDPQTPITFKKSINPDNLFANSYQNDQIYQSRQQISLIRQSQSSRLRNEAESQYHQRNSSACPSSKSKNEKTLLVQEYLNQNLFSRGLPELDKDRYVEVMSKMLRQSYQEPHLPQVQKQRNAITSGGGEQYDRSVILASGESNQRNKHVQSMQRHNKFNFQMKNPAVINLQTSKQKDKQEPMGRFGDLKLIGNQFQTKIFPQQDEPLFNIENRRGSNEPGVADTKDLLFLLKRRQLEQRETAQKKQKKEDVNDESLVYDDQSMAKADMTVNDATIKEIRNSIKLDKYDQDSRQPKVGLQKSEKILQNTRGRRFITAGDQHNTSKFSTKEQTTLISQFKNQNTTIQNSRAKLKSIAPEKVDSTAPTQDQTNSYISTDGGDPSRKTISLPRAMRQPKKYFMLPGNQQIQIETEEAKVERLYRLQKQIKAKYTDISQNLKQKDEPYKFIIIRGNNSELVKRVLDTRNEEWQEIPSINTLYNFKWSPFSRGIRFDYLSRHGAKKMVNHFECHEQLTEKNHLFQNMQRYYENQKKNVFDYLPITFTLECGSASYFNEIERFQNFFMMLERHKNDSMNERNANLNKEISAHGQYPQSKKSHTSYGLNENMFDGNNLWLLKPTDYNRGRGVQVFNSLEQLKKWVNEYQQGVEVKFAQQQPSKSLKTQQVCSSSGNEQFLTNFTNLDAVPNIVKTNDFVIQKYLERPLLLNKRKFDIRLWVLLTHEGKCYLFREGYIRTSSVEYDISPESLKRPFVHLTNNAVQRFNDQYGAFEEGNQLSLKEGSVILRSEGRDVEIQEIVDGQIQEIIRDSLKSVDGCLNPENRKHCFEIFGYDFIIDESLNPWLIEVNTNPCLEESSSLLRTLIPRMLDDAFKLTIDVIFPPKRIRQQREQSQSPIENISVVICSEPGLGSQLSQNNTQIVGHTQIAQQSTNKNDKQSYSTVQNQGSKFSVPGYSDTENMWNLIYQLKV